MANFGPSLWFVRDNAPTSTIGWSAVTAWAATTAKTAGQLVRQLATPTVGNERVFACIIAGTTLGSEPTWVVTKGAKTAEAAGPTWIEVTGQPGVNGNTTDSPTWLQNKNTAVTLGLIIYDSVSASLQIVSTAGTTGNGSAPSFSATAGTTTADNTVTWTSLGLASGFGAWAAPFARWQSVYGTSWAAAGDTTFIGDDHNETQSSAMTVTGKGSTTNPQSLTYSIDHTASLTLAGATLKAGGAVSTTGNSGLTLSAVGYVYGLTFTCGSGANAPTLNCQSNNTLNIFDTCAMVSGGTSNSSFVSAVSNSNGRTVWNNCTYKVSATGAQLQGTGGFVWQNTPSAIQGATLPTTLFGGSLNFSTILIDGVDLSALGSGATLVASANAPIDPLFRFCKLGSSVTVAAAPASLQGPKTTIVDCDSSGTNFRTERYCFEATQTTETVVVRSSGASNGTTATSYKIATTANTAWWHPFQCVPVAIWNATTGTNRVVTLYGIWNAAALPNNDDIWIVAEYLGSASSPQASFANNTKANNLATGSALTADSTSAWDSLVTARANSTVYTTASIIKLASNPGRVFFCTTGGTSAGSEPGGYSSAVDGGSVTDGTAVFRAGRRFTLSVTLSSPQPAMAGPITVTVNAAKVSSTFYVDPLINLS